MAQRVDDVLTGGVTVVPDDEVNIVFPSGTTCSKAVYVDGTGDIAAVMADGSELLFNDLAVGVFHRLSVVRIFNTGTTATGIKVLY
ncbi:hypothetical protein B2I21_35160 [Chryseobacterium mucoviscidosis]|nr:hypothetical protein B2I21_35160 [Chryseobacterium mucoviscidosis]